MDIKNNDDGTWTVESDSGNTYTVQQRSNGWTCDCKAGQFGRECKHVRAVIEMDTRQDNPSIGYDEADVAPDVEDMQAEIRAAKQGRRAYSDFLGY